MVETGRDRMLRQQGKGKTQERRWKVGGTKKSKRLGLGEKDKKKNS